MLGLNEYVGWYQGKREGADRMQWRTAYAKPLIISKFGGGAAYGRHGDEDERWTEECRANLFVHQISMLKRVPSLSAMAPGLLMDFRSPRRTLPEVQNYRNR